MNTTIQNRIHHHLIQRSIWHREKDTAPASVTPPSFNNATILSHSAEVVANADNYRVANQRIIQILHANSNNHRQNIRRNQIPIARRNHLLLHNIWTTIPPTHTTKTQDEHMKTKWQTTTPSSRLHHWPRLVNSHTVNHLNRNCTWPIHTQHRLHSSICTNKKEMIGWQRIHIPLQIH